MDLREIAERAGFVKTDYGWRAPDKGALPKPQCCEHCSRLLDNPEKP